MGYSVVTVDGNYLNPNVIVLENGYLAGRNFRDEEIKKLKKALLLIPKWTSNKNIIRISKESLEEIT